MHECAGLDELDLQLITTLQTAPRAAWQQIGQALGVAASTASRRWSRLTGAGLAWLSCHPVRLPAVSAILAIIEINCAAGRAHPVAADIAEDPHVFNVNHVTGSRDLVVTAAFADQASLSRYVGFRIGCLDGVRAVGVHIATGLHTDGSRWRLDRLDAERRGALLEGHPTANINSAGGAPDATDLALMTELSADPRLPASELAQRAHVSATSVRRRLARLDTARLMVYRCEVARCASGWPIAVNFWAAVPAERAAHVTAQIAGLRETRFCASLSGPNNLMFAIWLRFMGDVQPFEALLARRIPDLTIIDRSLVLWHMKLGGHILDPHGRHVRGIPMSLWPEQDAIAAEAALLARLRQP